jgi:hypothetical protein
MERMIDAHSLRRCPRCSSRLEKNLKDKRDACYSWHLLRRFREECREARKKIFYFPSLKMCFSRGKRSWF